MPVPRKNKTPTRDSHQEELANIAAWLPDDALSSLYEFAEFLGNKYPPEVPVAAEIVPIARPESEGVITAIKRLSKTYPMLDERVLFEQTSAAMSAHVLNEISAKDSIDRLEKVFRKEYEDFVARMEQK
ncbi:MAG: hypothetical protein GY697_11970 [Desulfobacterales bacterium]|nr:hypothetical protein [Desulfobacterales bacterium]